MMLHAQERNGAVAAHLSLAAALRSLGRPDQALADVERAVELDPRCAAAQRTLGELWCASGFPARALAPFRTALELEPEDAATRVALGDALRRLERFDEAVDAYREAPDARESLAYCLHALGRHDEAIREAELALAREPDSAALHAKLAYLLLGAGRGAESLRSYERALTLAPDDARIRLERALSLLRAGRLAEGWDEYESRWSARLEPRPYAQPRWKGERVDGVLLAWAEQGLGDHVLFAGMVPELRRRARALVLEVDPRLVALFARSFPDVEVVALRRALRDGRIDAHTPLAGAGRHLRRSWVDFPHRESGHLVADPRRVEALRARLGPPGTIRIGVSWTSRRPPSVRSNRARLADFAPLSRLAGCSLVDLQYGDTTEERRELEQRAGVRLQHLDDVDATDDLDGLAALIAACDAVVTIGNATAHLAGALGKPAWVLVPYGDDRAWYWFEERPRSPWYPRVELRYQAPGQRWAELVAGVVQEIARLAGDLEAPSHVSRRRRARRLRGRRRS